MFEGAPILSLGGQIYPEHPFEVRGRCLFSQIAGRAGRATSSLLPAAAPKGAGAPRSRANRILAEQDFWPSTALLKTPGSPRAGHRGYREAGTSLETYSRQLGGRCAAYKVVVKLRARGALVSFRGEDCVNGALCGAENAPGTQNFGPASKRQPIHGYQDQKLAPEANAGKPHCPCDEQGRPRCPSPAPDAHATAPPPRVPLERRSTPSAPRATRPHGRAASRPAALPTPPSRRHPQPPESSLPSRPPRSTSVASSSHRARETQSRKPSQASARRHLPERSDGCIPRSCLSLSLRAKAGALC